jgi:hypothetical protein
MLAMSEERMTELVQGALAARGIEDEVLAVGQFNPRGHSGGMFTGGLVGVSATTVYGFAAATRHSEPSDLVFQVPRAGLTAKVHQRVNVRVLELIDPASGSRIELEGNRLPLTHSKDVIDALGG